MITLTPGQLAAVSANVRGAVYLIEMQFASGTQYKTTHTSPIDYGGHTYTALGQILSVSQLDETGTVKTDRLRVRATILDTAVLAYLIGPASEYRNRRIKVYVQLLGTEWQPIENPILRWSGFMDKISVSRSPAGATGDTRSTGYIEMSCVRAGLQRFRAQTGLRMTHAQQQIEYPGDMGFEYTEALVNNPIVWLSQDFQRQV